MSGSRPGVAGFIVTPQQLQEARVQQDALAEAVEEVARAVRRLDVPTGRSDSEDGCGELLRQLSAALDAAACSTRGAALAVGAAGTRYAAVDAAAVR